MPTYLHGNIRYASCFVSKFLALRPVAFLKYTSTGPVSSHAHVHYSLSRTRTRTERPHTHTYAHRGRGTHTQASHRRSEGRYVYTLALEPSPISVVAWSGAVECLRPYLFKPQLNPYITWYIILKHFPVIACDSQWINTCFRRATKDIVWSESLFTVRRLALRQ